MSNRNSDPPPERRRFRLGDLARQGAERSEQRPGQEREKRVERAHQVRNLLASVVWLLAVLCAVILAVGALLAALGDNVNESNAVVEFVNDASRTLDGPFGPSATSDGGDGQTRQTLITWGLAAVAYLLVGRILDRLIRA